MATLERAIQIACDAHAGQVDKGGTPYVLHPLRLMMQMEDLPARIAAVMHDVVEDSGYTLRDLEREGFTPDVVAALDCLTRREGEHYEVFIERLRPNALARRVKLADLADNMDPRRLESLDEHAVIRMRRYHHAWRRLSAEHPRG